jgi:hypothetical protein
MPYFSIYLFGIYLISFVINRITMSINIANIVDRVDGAVDSARGFLKDNTSFIDAKSDSDGNGKTAMMFFPPEIRSNPANLPLIEFTAYERNNSPGQDASGMKKPAGGWHRVYLPASSSISFGDSGDFGTSTGKGIFAELARKFTETRDAASKILTDIGKASLDTVEGTIASVVPGEAGNVLSSKAGTIQNPNTNVTYNGAGIRSFTFAFKLIAKSEKEAKDIRKIQDLFRYFSYSDPVTEGTSIALSLPAPWTIRFVDSSLIENEYIPGIWSCYLTNVGTTFNSSSNIYFTDNAPLEVEISLTYQETRVLSRADLQLIKKDDTRGIINGKPSQSAPSALAGGDQTVVGEGGD